MLPRVINASTSSCEKIKFHNTNIGIYFPPLQNILLWQLSVSTFQLGFFEILILALSIADFNISSVITWDLCTLGRIGRNFQAASYRRAIYVIGGWIVGILSAMHGISCAGFHVLYFVYQGTLHQTRLIRLAIRGIEVQGERNREKLITRKHTELLSCVERTRNERSCIRT